MAWPPTTPPTGRADGTPQLTNHPDDHNTIAAALDEIVWRMSAGFRAARPVSTLSIPNNTDQTILPSIERYADQWAVSGSAYAYSGPDPMGFVLDAGVIFETNATGARRVSILLNGSEVAASHAPGNSVQPARASCSCVVVVNPGDLVSMTVWHNAGAALNLATGSMTYLGAAPAFAGS